LLTLVAPVDGLLVSFTADRSRSRSPNKMSTLEVDAGSTGPRPFAFHVLRMAGSAPQQKVARSRHFNLRGSGFLVNKLAQRTIFGSHNDGVSVTSLSVGVL
jgi:hypothetical protein